MLAFWLPLLGWTQPGNALNLDGTNDMVVSSTLPSLFSNLTANSFTMEAWVYPTGSIFSRIVFAQAATNSFATMSMGATRNIYFYVVVNGTNYSIATTNVLPLNTWTHVAVRFTAGTNALAVFFNGVLQAGAGGGTSSTGTSGLLTLGTRPGGAQYFPGSIDDVRVWSVARNQCDIVANMNRQFPGPQTNLVTYYDFNSGVASGNNAGVTTLTDLSGGGFNGTLTNFALSGATSNWIASGASISATGNALVGGYAVSASASVCSGGSYTFPDGSTQTNITAPVTQNSTFTAQNGCDSVVTTTLSVNATYAMADSATVCQGDSFTFADGTVFTNVQADTSHASTLQTIAGCDSIVTTTLRVRPSYAFNVITAVCYGASYTFPDGTVEPSVTQAMTQTSTLSTVSGCDSVIFTSLSVNPVYQDSISAFVCSGGSYTFPDGSTQSNITTAVSQTSSLQTVEGCDSVIVTNVRVTVVDPTYSFVGNSLVANSLTGTYQWIDCDPGFPVSGETNAIFVPSYSSFFALAVTDSGCTDTSDCQFFVSVDPALAAGFRAFPNPSDGRFTLRVPEMVIEQPIEVTVLDAVGRKQRFFTLLQAGDNPIDIQDLPAGIYIVHILLGDGKPALQLTLTRQ